MTNQKRHPMTPAMQAALVRGLVRDLASLRVERDEAVAEAEMNTCAAAQVEVRIEAIKANLARARKGQW